jgi:hypothetical protein
MNMKRTLLLILALCSTLKAQSSDPDTTNTLGARIDTDTERNAFLTALAGGTTISATELGYLDGLGGNIQTLLNAKLSLSGGALTGNLTSNSSITTTGASATIRTTGDDAYIETTGTDAYIQTTGINSFIRTTGSSGYIETRSNFRLSDGTYTTTLSHAPTANRAIAFPDASGTLALTSNLSAYLPLAGGTMTGAINMGAQGLTNAGSIAGATNITASGNIVGGSGTSQSYWAIDNDGTGNSTLRFRQATVDKAQLQWDNGSNQLLFYDIVNGHFWQSFYPNSGTVFNEGGVNLDFRIEGDTAANLFFADASTDRIGFGTSSPVAPVSLGDGTAGSIGDSTNIWIAGDNSGTDRARISMGVDGNMNYGAYVASSYFGSGGADMGLTLGTRGDGTDYPALYARFSKIGIGVTDPSTALDVSGTISFAANSGTWDGATISAPQAFSSTTRPTSSGTGTPATNSLITHQDLVDALTNEDLYWFREEYENWKKWDTNLTGTGSLTTEYSLGTTDVSKMKTGTTINSKSETNIGYGGNLAPVYMKPWVWKDRSMIEGSVADVKVRIGFTIATPNGGTNEFTGFEYDSSASANWRFRSNGAYTDTGVAAVADTWVSFKMRSNGNDNQIVWSVNGGAETTKTGAVDYFIDYFNFIENLAASNKILVKDYTFFSGTPSR